MTLKKIEPKIHKLANIGDWLVISPGRIHGSRGTVEKVLNLSDVMLKIFENRTILLAERINGEEEVPSNV